MPFRPVRALIVGGATAIAAGAAVATAETITPGFFLRDDAVNEFLPYLSEQARLWASGELPLVSTRSLSGGNLLVDFERSVFHPVMMLAAAVWGWTRSMSAVAWLIAFISVWATLLSAYAAASAFRIRGALRWFVALTAATSPLFVFMYLPSWWNAALATSAFLCLLAALEHYASARSGVRACLVGLAVLNTLLIGWPHGFIAMAILLLGYCARVSVEARRSGIGGWFLAAWQLVPASAIPFLIALPLFSEYLTLGPVLARETVSTNTNFGTPVLSQLLNVVNPAGGDFWNIWGGYRWWALPIGFVSLGLVLLVFVRDWRAVFRQGRLVFLAVLAALFLLLTQLPSDFGPLRVQFRMLPYAGIVLVIGVAVILSSAPLAWTRRRAALGVAVFAAFSAFAMWRTPGLTDSRGYGLILPLASLAIAAAGLAVAIHVRRAGAMALSIGLVGVALLGAQLPRGLAVPGYMGTADLPDTAAGAQIRAQLPDGLLLHATTGGYANAVIPGYASARYLLSDIPVLNGYDPVGQASYVDIVQPLAVQGMLPLGAIDTLAARSSIDDELCDLAVWGVRSVVAVGDGGAHRDALASCGFTMLRTEGTDSLYIDRVHPMAGTVSATSADVMVTSLMDTDTTARVHARNTGDADGSVVFARMAWPGYSATAAGQPIDVSTYQGVLTKLTVPAGFDGELVLTYAPRSWGWAVPLALVASVAGVALVALAFVRRRGRRPVRSEEENADD